MKHDNLNDFMHDGWSYRKNSGSVSEKQIENAVNKYFENNPSSDIVANSTEARDYLEAGGQNE